MNNFDFLKKYQALQNDIMSDRLIDLGFAQLTYSEGDGSSVWNNALTNINLDSKQIKLVENTFNKLDRKPTIYFENSKILLPLKKLLGITGYKFSFEDVWQFWKGIEIDTKHFDSVKQVENEKDLGVFLKTFNACYKKGDPQNPYGELGDYLNVARKVWLKHIGINRLHYFIVYKGSEPVAVSTLTNFEKIGYISNVGSLKSVRGEGFGKAVTLFCVQESIKNGNDTHCLATEEGHYPNEFYKRIGFESRFNAVGMSKIRN